jgi:hypothetical protein
VCGAKPMVFIPNLHGMNTKHVNRWDDVEHGINHLSIDHWCKPLIYARESIDEEAKHQGTYYNIASVNRGSNVEHS